MNTSLMLLLPILIPTVCGIIAGLVPVFKNDGTRRVLVLAALACTAGVTGWQIFAGGTLQGGLTVAPGMELRLNVDDVTRLFAVVIAGMWLMSGIFSREYMKHEGHRSRYDCFFLMSEGAMLGVAFAGNYITMYLFFEWMTLLSAVFLRRGVCRPAGHSFPAEIRHDAELHPRRRAGSCPDGGP